jgi:signal transduction histidine kinase
MAWSGGKIGHMPLRWRRRERAAAHAESSRLWRGLTLRAALVLGFGVTLGVWVVAGVYFAHRISDVGRRSADINTRYMRAQELLSTVRAQVLLGSVYVRDALLDPAPGTADDYRRQIQDAYRAADDALKQYRPVMDSPAERAQVLQLRRELDDFHATLSEILATDRRRWISNARDLLRLRIVPKRQVVVQLSEDVQALNRSAVVQQQAGIAAVYVETERHGWESLGLTLLICLGIALFATVSASRLEGRLTRQRERDRQNTRDLQRLSAKIVSVQEDERRHIARELHDEVGQVLTALKVELAVAQRTIEASGASAHVLDESRAIADRALHTVRDLSHLLHPAMLDDLGLSAAVEGYLREFGKRHGLQVELRQSGLDERLMPETEAAAFRIVQEALTNVANHAHAAICRIQLQRLPTTLLVTVDDDGRGFDPADTPRAAARPGLGLIGMRERVTQLLGTLRLESAPGKGTRLTVVLPAGAGDALADDEVAAHG